MARLPAELERLRTMTLALQTVASDSQPALPRLLPDLRALLGADAAVAYCVRAVNGRADPEFILGAGNLLPDFEAVSVAWFQAAPIPWGHFDPTRPAPEQRNVVMGMEDLGFQLDRPPPVAAQLFPRVGLAGKEQLRVLICEDESLLAWVGAFRSEPFTGAERTLLAQLVSPLRDRLCLERRLNQGAVQAAALHTVLEQLGAPAFLLGPRGRVVERNSAGRALWEADPLVEQTLMMAVQGQATAFQLSPVTSPGMPRHFLAVRRVQRPLAQEAAAAAATRWRLTPRQTEVLALLTEGLSNRAISAKLGCSESTVEIHVSAVLAKANVESRAALVARVWSQAAAV